MINETINDIKNNINLRQNLSKLKQELKEDGGRYALLYELNNDCACLIGLLQNEEPKTRKNAALVLGELGLKEFLEPLYNAYLEEDKLFVKSSYLLAIKELDFREYVDKFKERIKKLTSEEVLAENKKHITEEIKVLQDMIIMADGIKKHEFNGFNNEFSVVLLTNRNAKELIANEISEEKKKIFNAGVRVKTKNIRDILELRYIDDVLFALPIEKTCEGNSKEMALGAVNNKLIEFIKNSHKGEAPFYFRIEIKSKMPLDKKSELAKKTAREIEEKSNRQLINSTSNYEFEIRYIENKEGKFNILLKLYTITDDKFAYRTESVAASIKPSKAALDMFLVADYLKENAKILDPFCGAGTMLIERHKFLKANTMYGIDIYNEAIEKAKINTSNANQIIHYTNKDFFLFSHEYLFNEIITNMPFKLGRKTNEDIYEIYNRFFGKAKEHLMDDGVIIIHSHNKDYVYEFVQKYKYNIVFDFELSAKEETYLFVIRK